MKKNIFNKRLLICALLFIAATGGFQLIHQNGFFIPTKEVPHIIDSHLMPDCSDTSIAQYLHRFFDAEYVKAASAQYNRALYMRSFFLLDLAYPFIYCAFFLSLAGYWKGTSFYKILRTGMFLCVLTDLGENTSFAWFLYHPQSSVNELTAFFTTVKSVFFSLGGIVALLSFIAATIHSIKHRRLDH